MSGHRGWAEQTFGACALGDARRTRRLVDLAARLSRRAGASVAQCCDGDRGALLGSYRLIGNRHVDPAAIGEGGFASTAQQAGDVEVLLAVEDTTSVSYAHAVAADLGTTSSNLDARQRGYQVHSVLLLDGVQERTLGLIEQRHWCRKDAEYGKKHARKQRNYQSKESYKWQQASERVCARLGEAMARTISVCDRESDVYEYLQYKQVEGQRFVLRAQSDRGLLESGQTLFAALEGEHAWLYETSVDIAQRGGRAQRQARVRVWGQQVTLKPPAQRAARCEPLTLNVVVVEELPGAGPDRLRWILLTSEGIDSEDQVRKVVRYYELRWRIEEYHKAWKSGVGVERLRLQSAENLERMLVMTAFVAVRILQLREQLLSPHKAPVPVQCDTVLSPAQWQVLWQADQGKPLPATPPSLQWAGLAVAKLGGFTDTKRTGRPGWDTLWRGWLRLQERVEGFLLAQSMARKM